AGVREVRRFGPGIEPKDLEPGDVIVALGTGPEHKLDAPAIYLGTRSGALPYHGVKALDAKSAHLRSMESHDPLLRGVVLDGLTVEHATAVEPGPGARALVDLDGGTVLLAGGAGKSAWVYFGIDAARSDLV